MTTASGTGEGPELRVVFAGGSQTVDVHVQANDAHTVGELADYAASLLDGNGRGELWCERRGLVLDPDLPIAESGIRWGDRLLVGGGLREPTSVGGEPRFELLAGGGPCAGERWELGDGAYWVGRDPAAPIHIDDPSVSGHHLDMKVSAEGISISDADSANGTAIDGEALPPNRERALGEQDELELGRTMLRARRLQRREDPGLLLRGGRLDFNRPPRVRRPFEPFEKELPGPPSQGRKARLPLAAALLPLAAGVLLFLLLDSPVMLAIAGLSPLMAIGTFLGDRRGGKKSFAKASKEFRESLETAVGELDEALREETVRRRAELPDAAALIGRAHELAPSLWERRRGDADFLALRVGVADLPARSRVAIGRGGDRELRAEAERLLAERGTVPSVPVPVELTRVGVLGLTGARQATGGLARWLLLQAAILHSPDDLAIVAALGPDIAAEWSWLKWLPHLRSRGLGAVAVGRAAGEEMLEEINDLLKMRRAQERAGERVRGAQVLLLVLDESLEIDRGLLRAVLTDAAQNDIAAIWLGRNVRDLPGQAGAIVEAGGERAVLDLTDVASGGRVEDVSADSVSMGLAAETARLLSPLRDVSARGGAGDIPQRVGLLRMLGLLPPSPQALRRRWEEWDGGLRVAIGAGADGPLVVDLRNEGPHALIAGTTGSGKSELLRTFVASAAATVPPDRLVFLLIDYKGGSAFAPCASLPHVMDVVSDLDGHMAERALISLEAELKRRERTLAEYGAKDLQELMRRHPDAAPPMLVIAVDEFAKLREEIPEFVDGVVDIAQRGRSLGVHMVLAAQTLRNAFTAAIRANTNLRIALRVADDTESEDVISSPLAARIPSGEGSRGRAFVRTGSGDAELRELQSAYVSGKSAVVEEHDLRLAPFELGGLHGPASAEVSGSDSDTENDLTMLGEAATEAQREMGLASPAPPWLPMLPGLLSLEQLAEHNTEPGRAAVGLVDLPQSQQQVPLTLDLDAVGNVAAFGSGNSGKTTFLASAALALAGGASPDELCIYALDAGGGHLAPLAELPHCGGVISVEDEERVERLFRILVRRIEERVASRHASRDGRDEQRTVLLLDDIGSFAHQYDHPGLDSAYESLQRVLSSGRNAGVHVVLTASRRGDLPAALSAHIGQRLALRMATEEDMLSLGLDAKTIRGARLPVGRGFTQDSREFHIAIPMQDGERLTLEEAAASIPGERSPYTAQIGVLPNHVSRESLGASGDGLIALGLSDEHLGPANVDLSEMHMIVVGPYRSGRSTTLATLAQGAHRAHPSAGFHLLSPRRSPLRDLDLWSSEAHGLDACAEAAAGLLEKLEGAAEEEQFVFVDDGGELTDAMSLNQLERLVRVGRDGGIRVIAAVETGSARGIGAGWIRELRREGHGLLLQPDLAADGDLLAARLPRRVPAPLTPGRGFLVVRGSTELVQVAS